MLWFSLHSTEDQILDTRQDFLGSKSSGKFKGHEQASTTDRTHVGTICHDGGADKHQGREQKQENKIRMHENVIYQSKTGTRLRDKVKQEATHAVTL